MWLFALSFSLTGADLVHGYSRARCHAVTEVAIIATNRQLSKLHPIYQLMAPHFRYTLQVNSGARFDLLSAGGAIEQIYTPGEYVFAMASAYYRDYWTFASNALPNDLIKRQVRWIHYLAQWVSEWVIECSSHSRVHKKLLPKYFIISYHILKYLFQIRCFIKYFLKWKMKKWKKLPWAQILKSSSECLTIFILHP